MTLRRLSRDSHPLLSGGGSGGGSPAQAEDPPVFSSIAASRYFSAATTASGRVFTWGSGFSGELGFEGHSWVTGAREVDGVVREARVCTLSAAVCRIRKSDGGEYRDLGRVTWPFTACAVGRQAIADNGGATKVVTGSGGFCACLTSSGRCSSPFTPLLQCFWMGHYLVMESLAQNLRVL